MCVYLQYGREKAQEQHASPNALEYQRKLAFFTKIPTLPQSAGIKTRLTKYPRPFPNFSETSSTLTFKSGLHSRSPSNGANRSHTCGNSNNLAERTFIAGSRCSQSQVVGRARSQAAQLHLGLFAFVKNSWTCTPEWFCLHNEAGAGANSTLWAPH